jgi:NADH:ubiquinone oxidoreductase subunit 6 (subunit J)
MDNLGLVAGWLIAIFLGALGIIILIYIINGKIDLSKLISEKDGSASLSRFQFLIFTFVIAVSLLIIVVSQEPPNFPSTIPPEIFILLGISGGTYVISKGIQKSAEQKKE